MLANDGIWFQAVEFKHGIFDAKPCNDSCWAKFSPFEAWSVKRYLGLAGLKPALQFRMYARINGQSIMYWLPPDAHPEGWFCAGRFTLDEGAPL